MKIKFIFILFLIAFKCAYAGSYINEIKNEEVTDFMLNSNLVYDSPNTVGFVLRVFNYIGNGECVDNKICRKDKMILITSTFDEYPEEIAFEIPLFGTYKSFSVISTPIKEDGAYIVKLQTSGTGGVCKLFEIRRQKIFYKKDC
jgi:hypothetical protein